MPSQRSGLPCRCAEEGAGARPQANCLHSHGEKRGDAVVKNVEGRASGELEELGAGHPVSWSLDRMCLLLTSQEVVPRELPELQNRPLSLPLLHVQWDLHQEGAQAHRRWCL